MFPEIVRLEILEEISGFERSVFSRLLPCFDDVEQEAKQRSSDYLNRRSKNFDPEQDDEGCIEDDALSIELNHIELEIRLKQNFLNSSAVELRHLLEKRLKIVFGTHDYNKIKLEISKNGYDISTCQDWNILNKELRAASNAIKHGASSDAAKEIDKKYKNLLHNNEVIIKKQDLVRYLEAMREFWGKALKGRIVDSTN